MPDARYQATMSDPPARLQDTNPSDLAEYIMRVLMPSHPAPHDLGQGKGQYDPDKESESPPSSHSLWLMRPAPMAQEARNSEKTCTMN